LLLLLLMMMITMPVSPAIETTATQSECRIVDTPVFIPIFKKIHIICSQPWKKWPTKLWSTDKGILLFFAMLGNALHIRG